MSRYIDADRLLADLPKLCHSINDSNNCKACPLFDTDDDMCKVEDFIHSQPDADVFPTANVAKQKKGAWIWGDNVRCSNCNYKLQTTGMPGRCPNCGANMMWE